MLNKKLLTRVQRDVLPINSGGMLQEENMNKNKLQNMEQEFPFLRSFSEKNFGAFLRDKYTTLDIKVQRIDANTLFYFGDHADGHNRSFFTDKHYASLFTCFFFIDAAGQVIFSKWGRLYDRALIHILSLRRYLHTTTIIKAEIETWYKREFDEKGEEIDGIFKHFSHRKINMTINKEPEEGLSSLLDDPDLTTKLRLNARLMTSMICHTKAEYDRIDIHLQEIKNSFKKFFEERLQTPMYLERAFNIEIEGIKFLSLSTAGRLLITLDTPTMQISYIATDEENGDSRMGVNSIEGTIAEAKEITEKFIASCEKLFGEGKTFHDIFKTGKVGFAGHTFGK